MGGGLLSPLLEYLREAFMIGVQHGAQEAGILLVRETGRVPWMS